MRWQAMFADLEAQLDAADQAELAGEVADRSRREVARLRLADRFRMASGARLAVGLAGAGTVDGTVTAVGPDWVLLATTGQPDALVALGAVEWVSGLAALAGQPSAAGAVGSRLDLGYVLRVVARDRAPVAIVLRDGIALGGTIDRVGADFVDLAEHAAGEPRRAAAVHAVRTVSFAALAVIRAG
jgi:hypothetical protein